MTEPHTTSQRVSPAAHARTFLFVPGDRPERFTKAASAGADLVVLDLEDAVAPSGKAAARDHVIAWLADTSVPCAVRVNTLGTHWHDDDLVALAELGDRAVTVILPKAETSEQIGSVITALPRGSDVVALVETACGVLDAVALAKTPGVARLALGSYDLGAELGIDPDHAAAMHGARTALVLASAAARLAGPVDGVSGDVRDVERLVAEVRAAAALGFTGKLCIHPNQVGPTATALRPSPDEIAWARRIEEAAATVTDGVILVDGRMVDAPVIARAQRILDGERSTNQEEH